MVGITDYLLLKTNEYPLKNGLEEQTPFKMVPFQGTFVHFPEEGYII